MFSQVESKSIDVDEKKYYLVTPEGLIFHEIPYLYAVDDNGDEILMTKDHIIPRSKGGIDDISNYQTMCKLCNEAKGNKLED